MTAAIHHSYSSTAPARVDWVDYAKGICIVLVVMMHSTLGVEKVFGFEEHSSAMGQFIAWARPFRMPDFFLISGLFLARRIAAPWPRYADTKVVHFLYFYFLWAGIQFLTKGYGIAQDQGLAGLGRELALALVEPLGTLWFIYLLAIFFVVTKLLSRVPPLLVFVVAAALELAPIHTGWIVIDEFAARYVYFFAGYWLAERIFAYADHVRTKAAAPVLALLAAWAVANGALVFAGYAALPVMGLALGAVGIAAVIALAVLLTKTNAAWPIQYIGANSIVIYLAFFLFMAVSRSVLVKIMPGLGVNAISVIVTAAGVIGPVILHLIVKRTPLKFLFVRPQWARVESWGDGWHSAGDDKPRPQAEELRRAESR